MRNQTSFRLTTTLQPTDTTAKTTYVINKLDADGNQFYPTFTEETVVLTNDDRTIMETTRATCTDGVLTFVKRGLSDDSSATEVSNRKLTWNPGTIAFITAGASDWIDPDDDITWTGKQTYSDDMTSNGKATYNGRLITKKGVEYPSFEDATELEAYADPFGGMFATVEDTGQLYRYNAVTEQWDMVSTVDLGTYEIRADDEAPAPGTADTIVTIVPSEGEIYLGDTLVSEVNKPEYKADILVVGGGGAGAGNRGGGGGGGSVVECQGYTFCENKCVTIGAGGAYNTSTYNGGDGGYSAFGELKASGGKGGKKSCGRGGDSGNGNAGGTGFQCGSCSGGGGGGASSFGYYGGMYRNPSSCFRSLSGGAGGLGIASNIDGKGCGYGGGGGGGGSTSCSLEIAKGYHGGGNGGGSSTCCYYACPGNYYGGGGGGGISCSGWDAGKAGCQGVVIVRYPADGSYGYCCATGGTTSCCCIDGTNYCIHTFTSDGTFCIVS